MGLTKRKIFILEDVQADAELMLEELTQSGMPFESRVSSSHSDLVKSVKQFQPDIILSDYSLPGFNGLHAYKLLQQHNLHIPFILVTGELSEDILVEFLKEGIDDYVMKINMKRLPHAVDAALKKWEIELEKEQALAALKESNEKYRQLVKMSSDAIMIETTKGEIIEVNPAGAAMFGYHSPEEMIGVTIKDLVPEDLAEIIPDEITERETTKGIFVDRLSKKKDGTIFPTEISTIIITINGEKRLIAYLRDITERKKAEQYNQRLLAIFEATSDFVGISGTDSKSQYINSAGKKLLGIHEHMNTDNINVNSLQPGWAVRYIVDEAIPYAIKHGIWRGETALLTMDKKEIPVSQVIIAHKNDKGEVKYFSTIAREIRDEPGVSEKNEK